MVLSELLGALATEGLPAAAHRIQRAVETGKISPVQFDGAGNRDYSEQHLAELREILKSPTRRGRKRRAVAEV
jgi:hypothetical protein